MAELRDTAFHEFRNGLAHLQASIGRQAGSLPRPLYFLEGEDVLKCELVDAEPPQGGLYDHLTNHRTFFLSTGLLEAFSRFWELNSVSPSRRRHMCMLFFVHEFFHIPQKTSSESYLFSSGTPTLIQTLDYDADAVAVRACVFLALAEGASWPSILAEVTAANLLGSEAFSHLEGGTPSGSMDGERFRRQLLWCFQYARAKAFPAECNQRQFGVMVRTWIEVLVRRGKKPTNLCSLREVSAGDVRAPLEVHVLRGDERRIYTISLAHHAQKLAEAVFKSQLDSAVEAFRPFFDNNKDWIGRHPTGDVVVPTSRDQSERWAERFPESSALEAMFLRSDDAATADLVGRLRNAKKHIRVFGLTRNFYVKHALKPILEQQGVRIPVSFYLMNPACESRRDRYRIEPIEAALEDKDRYIREILEPMKGIARRVNGDSRRKPGAGMSIYLFNFPISFSIEHVDDACRVMLYSHGHRGTDGPVLVFSAGTPYYEHFVEQMDWLNRLAQERDERWASKGIEVEACVSAPKE